MNDKKFIATLTRTRQILNKHHFTFKKSIGKNFIVDVNILENMIQHAGIDRTKGVIEIGPGIGALTEQLAIYADRVVAFEIDDRLLPILNEELADYPNIHMIHQNILEADVHAIIKRYFHPEQPIHIVANLPYYITTPILTKLLRDRLPVENFTVMIQKEVADRMAAQPNSKSYGSLTIAIQYYTHPEVVMNVPKSVFIPQPNVDSSILRLTKREDPPVHIEDENYFFPFVQACFAQRRKTLRNNLAHFYKDKYDKQTVSSIIQSSGLDGSRRAESLKLEEFSMLANVFYRTERNK